MKIFIALTTGKSLELNVQFSDSIKQVKEKIWRAEGIPTDEQRLIFVTK